jgi:putative peptide zinc metalloprotease protein
MSATVDTPAASAAPVVTERPRALERADGLELLGDFSGSGYKATAALVRRADGQMVQLGPLMYALLEEIDGRRDARALAAAVSERLGRRLDAAQVGLIADKLAAQGLLAGSEENAPPRSSPLLALRWKVLFTDPKITRRISRPFEWLFRPWVMLPALAGFAAVCWFVLIHHGVAAATAQAFDKPELLLLVLGLTIASAALHEIGHAAACRYGGGRPGGMGAGIYLVWPAFYTDVTDAYRLPRRARLRTDLGGIYFNAVIAVLTLGAWLITRVDALLLLIAIQMLEIVKNLSPAIRSDGYHILSDATGVPDLYAHVGPTLRRLLPWKRREPSALTGKARLLVTAWVLVIVPVLASMAFGAILLFPKLAASTYESGSHLVSGVPGQADGGDVLGLLATAARLLALALPVAGVALLLSRLVRSAGRRAWGWSAGRPGRRALVVIGAGALAALLAWAWWPSGQYRAIRASDRGTLPAAIRTLTAPATVVRPMEAGAVSPTATAAVPELAPGRHLAVALIPRGGPTEEHPALYVIDAGAKRTTPTILVSTDAPDAGTAPTLADPAAVPGPTGAAGAAAASSAPATRGVATQLPFTLPEKPGPGDSQALAVNTTDGGIVYDVAYSLVTVTGGAPVRNENSAYALASCRACTTLAVSFQLVLVVGQTDSITPINVAEALNLRCPECITTAIAKQLVISLRAAPSAELQQRLQQELEKLDAIEPGESPADVLDRVNAIADEIQRQLDASGLTYPKATATPAATTAPGTSATPVPTGTATAPAASPTPTATPTATLSATATTTPRPTATATPTATSTPAPTATQTPAATATP